jgi:hypothetical protein
MAKNVIVINGQRIEVEGDASIRVKNNEIFVDGTRVASDLLGTVNIKWEGPLATLTADGSVECDDVDGDVSAGGSVQCGNVEGDVSAGGSVQCGDVEGDISSGGSVTVRNY